MVSDDKGIKGVCLALIALLLAAALAGCAPGDSPSGSLAVSTSEPKRPAGQVADAATPEKWPNTHETQTAAADATVTTSPMNPDGAPDATDSQERSAQNTNEDFLRFRPAPMPPPPPKWEVDYVMDRIVTVEGVDYLASAPMRAEANGIAIEILATSVNHEIARVFVTIWRPGQGQDRGPHSNRLPPILPAVARLVGEDGRSVHDSQHIESIVELDGLTLALISLPLAGNQSPKLSLDVPAMHVGPPNNVQESVSGAWRVPLLIDNSPGEAPQQTQTFISTDVLPHVYDNGVKVRFGDSAGTPSGMHVDYPRGDLMEGDLAEAWVFTLTSVDGQETTLYLIMLTDGSVKQVSKAEYDAILNATIYAPNPTPVVAPNQGPNPPEFPTPPPFYTPDVSRPMEEVIQEHLADLTPAP